MIHILMARETNKPGRARRAHFMKDARVHIVLGYTHALKITRYVVEGFHTVREYDVGVASEHANPRENRPMKSTLRESRTRAAKNINASAF